MVGYSRMCIKELKFRIYRFKNSLTFFIKCDWGFWISKSWDENADNFTKKDVFGKHFIDLKNENIVGPLKWLHLFYQHLPNKLDSLEKIQNWYIMETEWRITLTGQILTCHFTEGSLSVLNGQRAVRGASLICYLLSKS